MFFLDDENEGKSLGNKIFLKLQEQILSGELQSGDALVEIKISKQYSVSRTPVREAIIQLEREGLVEIIPHKGAYVIGISQKDINDIYSIRVLIEGLATRWATENITDDQIEELREVLELEEFYTVKKNNKNISKIDYKFHKLIYKASKSKTLIFILKMLHFFTKNARELAIEDPVRAKESLQEHLNIFYEIEKRDKEKAEEAMIEHVKNARDSMIKRCKK